MISSLKRSSLTVSKHIGLSELLAHSEWRRRRLLVLCYHGISLDDEHEWHPTLYVSPDHLEHRLALLRRNRCSVLPLGEALERLYRGDLPERAVVLTFDDGYFDFKARAWPLLQKYGYPATVYLTTCRVEHNFPIANLFASYVLWQARARILDGRGLPGLSGTYGLSTAADRQHVVRQMDAEIQAHDHTAEVKDSTVKEIATRVGLDYEALFAKRVLRLLQPEEVTRLAQEGVDFQLHTHFHRNHADPQRFVDDVVLNRERIEALTGTYAKHLCYPSGIYHLDYLPVLRREGIVSGTTCDPGLAAPTSEPLLLPRFVDTSSITDIEFEGWVSGVASCLPRRTRRAS
jgi:peptidoglycan/xylan/chitin deacetylase (PgdA/CDA1 family)